MSFSNIRGFNDILGQSADELAEKIAKDPEEVQKVQKVVNQVLDKASYSPIEWAKAKEFLSKIEAVNQKIVDARLQTAVQRLHATFDGEVVIGTPITLASIKEDINKLKLTSKGLSGEIGNIKEDLAALKAAKGISAEQAEVLSDALDSLKESSFKPSLCETLFLDHCAAKNPALQKAIDKDLPDIVEREQQYGRSKMLEAIKESLKTPDSLSTVIPKKKGELEAELTQKRFHALKINSPPFDKNFEKNLPQVIRAFETFSKNALKAGLKQKWEAELAKLKDELGSDFVTALQKHPSYDLAANYEMYLLMIQKNYLGLLDLNQINESASITTYLKSLKEPTKRQALSYFDRIISRDFQKKIVWLSENYDNVEKAYEQTDPNTNLGSGVCFSNCLERTKKLLTNPALPSKDIAMGSTQASRMTQNLYQNKQKGSITPDETAKIEKETADRFGLTPTKKLLVPYDKDDPTKHLGSTLQQVYNESGKKALPILSLYAPGKGHAINIQMDEEDGQFRFLDDNFGICGKYASFEDFQKAFTDYLKAAYGEYNKFTLLVYSLAS